ncbi:hypothetical protein QR680_001228 [Steinernema hermaphroditum]|uniref:FLYWCH-type domain-containing protein n=1 Tax=Steinernema hermaphroditum TaxID=289476 RepID=A0AA39GXD2_9BILA|nr:hypothetical protein QR680_001228 [Steinernema hermaphroditum]
MEMEIENAAPDVNIDLNTFLNTMDFNTRNAFLEMLIKEGEKLNGAAPIDPPPQLAREEQKPLEIAVPLPQQPTEPAPQSSNSNTATESSRSSKSPSPHAGGWYECFRGNSTEVRGLINTLCIFKKENSAQYECLNRRKFKCQYKFRVNAIAPDVLICEETGYHSHSAGSMEPLPSQGAPKELKELVDRSYYENWPTAVRQQAFRAKIIELGLDMKQALRQTDNRLSYIRRTKKINSNFASPKMFIPYN